MFLEPPITRKSIPFTFAVLAVFSAAARGERIEGMRYVMGTMLRVEMRGASASELRPDLDKIFGRVRELEGLLSSYDSASEVSKMAREAPEWVGVSPETLRALLLARLWAERTGGAFEPTIRPLVRLWGFDVERLHKPTDREIARVLPLLNFRLLETDPAGLRARLAEPGAEVDLGGIGKGYALDRVRAELEASGASSAVLDFGGELLFWGEAGEDEDRFVGIRDFSGRRSAEGDLIAGFTMVRPGAVATSSNAERFLEEPGLKGGPEGRYGHILNPRTGKPVADVRSVTVIAPEAATADALSTALFVMGPGKGLELVDALVDTAAVMFYRDGSGSLHWAKSASWDGLARGFEVYGRP